MSHFSRWHQFSKVSNHFPLPPAAMRAPPTPRPQQHLVLAVLFIPAILGRVCDSHQWQVGLSIFACAGYPCARPFGAEATQVFSYLLTETLCMFWTQTPWSLVCIVDIFSRSAVCLSTSLMVSFNKQEFLISTWSNLSTFSYGSCFLCPV